MDRKTAMQQLSARSGARNAFLTNHAPTKYGADLANGLFTWDLNEVHFDYFGTGKIRRISIHKEELQHDNLGQLAPSPSDKQRGERTQFPGTAFRNRTTMAERAVWNTINARCNGRFEGSVSPLEILMYRARDAYARVTTDKFVFYFQGGKELEKPHYRAEVFSRNVGSDFFYSVMVESGAVVSLLSNFVTSMDQSWGFTSEQIQYVVVARDAALEGRTDMPLHGMVRRHR